VEITVLVAVESVEDIHCSSNVKTLALLPRVPSWGNYQGNLQVTVVRETTEL